MNYKPPRSHRENLCVTPYRFAIGCRPVVMVSGPRHMTYHWGGMMAAAGEENKDWILEPLSLPESPCCTAHVFTSPALSCIFCEECFPAEEQEKLLRHMILEHKLVIADVKLIVDFRRYVLYWKKRFIERPITDFCSIIRTNSQGPKEEQADYYLLCDVLPEDRVLREQLQQKRLETVMFSKRLVLEVFSLEKPSVTTDFQQYRSISEDHDLLQTHCSFSDLEYEMKLCFNGVPKEFDDDEEVLEQQQQERNDSNFARICMFCNEEFAGNRAILFNHMAKDHSFNVGLPDNIVYCNEFLDLVQKKIDNLQCLYCEKTFRDKNTLKDHMRKKQHRRINAKNQEYDKFYTINYLELGKSWEEVQSEDDREMIDEQDDDWSDWQGHPICAVCLFCEKAKDTTEKLQLHMKEAHCFDLLKLKSEMGLNFYQQIKLVNFIRREIHQCRCNKCGKMFSSKAEVVSHMTETNHIMSLLDRSAWDQPQYYFPTYENDALLCSLSDCESESVADNQTTNIPVIAEDISNLQALKQSSILNLLQHPTTKN